MMVVTNEYCLLSTDELFDQLQGAKYFFSKTELRSRHHQLKVKRDLILMKTLCTCYGHYEILVMSFRFNSAPTSIWI
jgi:hypothetical protein